MKALLQSDDHWKCHGANVDPNVRYLGYDPGSLGGKKKSQHFGVFEANSWSSKLEMSDTKNG